MRKLLILSTLIFPLFVFAQQQNPYTRQDSLRVDPLHLFYAHYGLNPDSAQNPQLFLDVFAWLGTKYKYGGHSTCGVDCSGFVSAVYRSAYCIDLEGGSKSLFAQVDTVPRGQLQEGDILFFKIKKGQISHVAVYLGNNKFAHASVHGGVMVDDLNEPYYKKYFFRGGRLRKPVYLEQ